MKRLWFIIISPSNKEWMRLILRFSLFYFSIIATNRGSNHIRIKKRANVGERLAFKYNERVYLASYKSMNVYLR